jgi:hypothetical protein
MTPILPLSWKPAKSWDGEMNNLTADDCAATYSINPVHGNDIGLVDPGEQQSWNLFIHRTDADEWAEGNYTTVELAQERAEQLHKEWIGQELDPVYSREIERLKIDLSAATASRNHAQLLREAADSDRDFWKRSFAKLAKESDAWQTRAEEMTNCFNRLRDSVSENRTINLGFIESLSKERDYWKSCAEKLVAIKLTDWRGNETAQFEQTEAVLDEFDRLKCRP